MSFLEIKSYISFFTKRIKGISAFLVDIKLKHKLLVSFLFLSIIPLLIICIFTYTRSSSDVKAKIQNYSIQVMNQAGRNIQTQINSIEGFCDELMMNKAVQNGLISYGKMDDLQKRSISVSVNKLLDERYAMLEYITNLSVLTEEKDSIYNYGYSSLDIKGIGTKNVSEGMNNEKSRWSYISLKDRNNVSVTRTIKNMDYSGTKLGYLIISFEEKWFLDIYKDIDIGNGADIFIIDSQGMVISSRSTGIIPGLEYKEKQLIQKITNTKDGISQAFTLTQGNEKYLVTYSYIKNADWYIVSTVPYSYLNSQSKETGFSIAIVGVICLFAAIQLSLMIADSISSPLNEMVDLMKEAEGGNLVVRLNYNAKNEVGYLAKSFNSMLKQIRKLIELVKEEQKNKRKAEIRMLQAQINPHFLFNTLNSLKWTAALSQAHSVSEGLGALAELLKNTIINTEELVSLQEEFKNIENYIVIQRIRYGTMFEVEYHIDKDLLHCKILKFLMQPIIENSIIHGIEDMDNGATIEISCFKHENNIRVIISDNGKGMGEEKVRKLMGEQCSSNKKLSGIGVTNVIERIKLNFGEEYSLYINSSIGQGTEVVLILPYINEDGVENYV
jgi:two-component system, sensor histidine kinase YesM